MDVLRHGVAAWGELPGPLLHSDEHRTWIEFVVPGHLPLPCDRSLAHIDARFRQMNSC